MHGNVFHEYIIILTLGESEMLLAISNGTGRSGIHQHQQQYTHITFHVHIVSHEVYLVLK